MAKWAQINESTNRFRLLCNANSCSLSLANVVNGMLSISTVHGTERHSSLLSHEDMLFIVSQYLNSLSSKDRENILQFFHSF